MDLPSIKPSMFSQKWVKSEQKVNRAEKVKKMEDEMSASYRALITKGAEQVTFGQTELPNESVEQTESGSEVSHATSERDLPEVDMTEDASSDSFPI